MIAPLDQRKAAIKDAISAKLRANAELHDRFEIGLSDLRRDLAWKLPVEPLTQDGRFVAKMLNALGWRRAGWLDTGYDRQARYVPEVAGPPVMRARPVSPFLILALIPLAAMGGIGMTSHQSAHGDASPAPCAAPPPSPPAAGR